MQAQFVRFEWENAARTIGTVYFRPNKPYYFTAGQYADFTVPHNAVDHRGPTRTMTLITSPNDKLIGFTTRFSKNNSSYKTALLNLQPNDTIRLTDPMGDLVLPLDESIPLVFVAGGVAVSSYISMIRWLYEQRDKRSVTLLYAVRSRADIIFQSDFDAYTSIGSVRRVLYTTDNALSPADWPDQVQNARLTSRDIMHYVQNNSQIYLSGAESMVEQLRTELEKDHKVDQYRIAFDYYEGYSEL